MTNYPMRWLIAKDDKEKLYSVEGKDWDDRAFTAEIFALQEKGAPVRCDTPEIEMYRNIEDLEPAYAQIGYKYSKTSVLDKYR